MSRENYSKYLQNKDSDILHSTGYSNSRLGGNFCTTPQPELNFDAMTIVGNLNKNNAQKLSEFMSVEPQIRLCHMSSNLSRTALILRSRPI